MFFNFNVLLAKSKFWSLYPLKVRIKSIVQKYETITQYQLPFDETVAGAAEAGTFGTPGTAHDTISAARADAEDGRNCSIMFHKIPKYGKTKCVKINKRQALQ